MNSYKTHPNELLYWDFRYITFSIATAFESQNRIVEQDSRRQLFVYHYPLLLKLNADWETRVKEEYTEILKSHPLGEETGPRLKETSDDKLE